MRLLATHNPLNKIAEAEPRHVKLLSSKSGARRGSKIKHAKRNSMTQHMNDSASAISTLTSGKRLVIYMSRPFKSVRGVANEAQIVSLLKKYVRPEYDVITTGLTPEYQNIEALHDSWVKSAAVFSRARVLIGPHGGAFNNLMWVPGQSPAKWCRV